MAQYVVALATKFDNVSSLSELHMVECDSYLLQVVLHRPTMGPHPHSHAQAEYYINKIFRFLEPPCLIS